MCRRKVSQRLLPKLRQFQPDLLFISAGFDTHVDDFYHFLTEEDIHWITMELCNVVEENPHSLGVISVLEGGYSLQSTPVKAASSSAATGAAKGRSTRRGGGGGSVGEVASSVEQVHLDPHTMYAQQPGDGGLVKG